MTAIVWNPKTMKETTEIRPQILIIDDDVTLCAGLRKLLRGRGYKVECIYDGDSGLHRASEGSHDLVILDVMMPEMDGIEACEQIRKLPGLEHTIIAFLTARNEDYSQVAGFEVGADDYIAKPVKPKVLKSRLKALLRRRPSNSTSTQERTTVGDVVIDPFMGTGTTGVCCKSLDRNFIGIEIDPLYYEIANNRIKKDG